MKLTGWATLNVERKPQTLDLERKGANNWSVEGPGGVQALGQPGRVVC